MFLLFLYLFLALGISFLCSVLEAVLLSISPAFVIQIENIKPKLGQKIRQFKEHIDRPLAAILSLNTIAHTVGAAGVGAQAVEIFGHAYVGIISAILTLLILLISEIIPKTLGAVYWRQLAPTVIYILGPLALFMWPLVRSFEVITRLLKSSNEHSAPIARDEFLALIQEGRETGAFDEKESRILRNLLLADQLHVGDIMTPRTVIFGLDETLRVGSVSPANIRFSRIPLFAENRDKVIGFVLKSDLLTCVVQGREDTLLQELNRPIAVALEQTPLSKIFDRLIGNQDHIALVVGEDGELLGLVTMEDIIETLIGMEIIDESDTVRDMREFARDQWSRRARRMNINVDRLE